MRRTNYSEILKRLATKIDQDFADAGIELTIGGEPTYVPFDASAPEWNFTAVGPTKLGYGWKLTEAVTKRRAPGSLSILAPGKIYPGETNPRWVIHVLSRKDGKALNPNAPNPDSLPSKRALDTLKKQILEKLGLRGQWVEAVEPDGERREVFVLAVDHNGKTWITERWPIERPIPLTGALGAAGLRLPLHLLPEDSIRRAIVLEMFDDHLGIFLPPLLQNPYVELLEAVLSGIDAAKIGSFQFYGYVPSDDEGCWSKLAIAPDPGVLEINLPACSNWDEYRRWIEDLDSAAEEVGLRPYKRTSEEEEHGSGGGNHILFGGPDAETNAFFKNPGWVTSILRFWQHHPSLSYLFTGQYVGSASQAPRPDESSRELYDLEMAYRFLESLEPGDHRYIISETLRHLHTDGSGNTHRSEISFDKFWSVGWPGGCRGLIEFRAIETLPRAEWTNAVALLWLALAARLYHKRFTKALIPFGRNLHDRYFLPTLLWEDFETVLADLKRGGYGLPAGVYREIWNWRFPTMLDFDSGGSRLVVRRAHEGWPLLCETPLEGGNTSRFVDTSIERLEFLTREHFTKKHRIYVQGRELKLKPFCGEYIGAGLRYRRTALHPSLHPGIPPHMPLIVTIKAGRKAMHFRLGDKRRQFEAIPASEAEAHSGRSCQKLDPQLLTYDLRLP